MTLLAADLGTSEIVQQIKPTRNLAVQYIRPHLYRNGHPTGSLILKIEDVYGRKIAQSSAVNLTTFVMNPDYNYLHGYLRFPISANLKKDESYRIALTSSGYTFSYSAYVAWCSDFDLRKVNRLYTVTGRRDAPLDMELWGLKRIYMGDQ